MAGSPGPELSLCRKPRYVGPLADRSTILHSPTTRCWAPIPAIRRGRGRSGRRRRGRRSNSALPGFRIARLGGYFARSAEPSAFVAVDTVARRPEGESVWSNLPKAARARAAAFLITMIEGAALHLQRLQDPRGGFRSGRSRPAGGRRHAARRLVRAGAEFRRRFREGGAFCSFATPTFCSRRRRPAARPCLGQRPSFSTARNCRCGPISGSSHSRFLSSVCRWSLRQSGPTASGSPLGVQIIAPPWREDLALARRPRPRTGGRRSRSRRDGSG